MNILHVNFSLTDGAGHAVSRINEALVSAGIGSQILCYRNGREKNEQRSIFDRQLNALENRLVAKMTGGNSEIGYPSLNLFPSSTLSKINNSKADIIHLHWINGEMISIAQIARIHKPIVWTFHSMWPCLGMHHWEESGQILQTHQATRFQAFLDEWTFLRKKKHWKDLNCTIICPSRWMAECAGKSSLFEGYPISVVPNCLDVDVYKILLNGVRLRKKFGLPEEKKVILFGATKPGSLRKGGDLIIQILQGLKNHQECVLAVFGTSGRSVLCDLESRFGIQTHNLGYIENEDDMAELYNTADVMCIPSRMDNLPSTCVEAQACGVPVVAFDVGGLSEIILHAQTGFLATPYSIECFKEGIEWCLSAGMSIRELARQHAVSKFSPDHVANTHVDIYRKNLSTMQ